MQGCHRQTYGLRRNPAFIGCRRQTSGITQEIPHLLDAIGRLRDYAENPTKLSLLKSAI